MKILFSGLLLWLGTYFSVYSSRLALLRTAGPTPGFKFLDAVIGYGPYLAAIILLIAGFLEKNTSKLPKLLSTLISAALPVVVHVFMYAVTYTTADKASWVLLRLSVPEFIILLLGIALIVAGLLLGFSVALGRGLAA